MDNQTDRGADKNRFPDAPIESPDHPALWLFPIPCFMISAPPAMQSLTKLPTFDANGDQIHSPAM
jgi:hypothetical protein